MSGFTPESHLARVLERFRDAPDPRARELAEAFVRHAFAFIRETRPTEAEFMTAAAFLAETGRRCDEDRQEFVLLADTFGLTMLVDGLNHAPRPGATESSVLGPFYRRGAPRRRNGESIALDGVGEPVTVTGRVTDTEGAPIAGAALDVWQTAGNGLYRAQDPGQPDGNACGVFVSDADGRFEIRTVKPSSYPVPADGPAGRLLKALGRHPMRPAHIHFIVSAEGYKPVVTQLFTAGDEYLDSDAVFGVKESLTVDYARDGDGWRVERDFGLEPAAPLPGEGRRAPSQRI